MFYLLSRIWTKVKGSTTLLTVTTNNVRYCCKNYLELAYKKICVSISLFSKSATGKLNEIISIPKKNRYKKKKNCILNRRLGQKQLPFMRAKTTEFHKFSEKVYKMTWSFFGLLIFWF